MGRLLFLLLILLSGFIYGDPKVSLDFSPQNPTISETIIFSVNVEYSDKEKEIPAPQMPSPKDLKLIDQKSSTSSSSSISIINGKMTKNIIKTTVYQYVYKPLKTGNLEFGTIIFSYQGKVQKSNLIMINVEKDVPHSSDILFKSIASNKSPYVGEQINFTIRLQYKPNAPIRNPRPPNLEMELKDDFIVRPLFDDMRKLRPAEKEINNERWIVFDIPYVLFPLRSGEITIPGIKGFYDRIIQNSSRRRSFDPFFGDDFFSDFFGSSARTVEKTLFTNSVILNVKSLPTLDKPKGFSGTVGSLNLKTQWSTGEIKAGEALTLNITLEGDGNVNTFADPGKPALDDFEVFEPEIKSSSWIAGKTIKGKKHYKYLLIPKKQGQITIGPFFYVFFNTDKSKYVTLQTEPYKLNVLEGDISNTTGARRILSKEDIRLLGKDIRYIKTSGPLTNQRNYYYKNSTFLGLHFIPLLFAVFAFIARKRKDVYEKDKSFARRSMAFKKSRKALSRLSPQMKRLSAVEYYSALARILNEFFADKLSLAPAGLTREIVRERLEERKLPENIVKQVECIYDEYDFIRFASQDRDAQSYNKSFKALRSIIEECEKNLN
ncbi:MAG: BatD family protein [bacterium]